MADWSDEEEQSEQWQPPRHGFRRDRLLLWRHREAGDEEANRSRLAELAFRQTPEERIRARFNELVGQWHREIGHKSALRRIVFNKAYLSIMLMAVDDDRHKRLITKFILEELRDRGGHWFWALQTITGVNPTKPEDDDFRLVRDAWIRWGIENGYLEKERVA